MLEIFQYEFMVRAFIVGSFTAITTAALGNFVVASRQAVISDMLAHTALVGVGLGILLDISPVPMGVLATVISGLLLWWLSRHKSQAPEAISMLLLTGGLAMALLLTHIDKNNPVGLETYLFGSILTITPYEMYWFVAINALLITTTVLYWRKLLSLVFDSDFLQTQGSRTSLEILFTLMLAVLVGMGIKVIGGLLIGALLVIPVLIAQTFTKSFSANAKISIFANVLAVNIGLCVSFYADVPASSAIVLTLVSFFILAKALSSVSS